MKLRCKTLMLLCAVAVVFGACQKEVDFQNAGQGPGPGPGPGPGTNTSIKGDYQFIGLHGIDTTTVITSEMGMELKAVAISDYTSIENGGTLKVTDNQLIITDLTYRVQDTVLLVGYLDGMLMAVEKEAYDQTVPSTGNTADYTRNHPDSITIANWNFMLPDPSGNPSGVASGPQVYGTRLSNDTLTLTSKYDFTTTGQQNGVPATMRAQLALGMRFKRK